MSALPDLMKHLRATRDQIAAAPAPDVTIEIDQTADLKTQRKQMRNRKRAEARQRTHLHLQQMLLARFDAAIAALEIAELLVSDEMNMFHVQEIDEQLVQIQNWRSFDLGWFDYRTIERTIEDTVYTFGPYVTYRVGVDNAVHNYYLGGVPESIGDWPRLLNEFMSLKIPATEFWKRYIQFQNKLDEQEGSA